MQGRVEVKEVLLHQTKCKAKYLAKYVVIACFIGAKPFNLIMIDYLTKLIKELQITSRKIIFYGNFVSFWTRHSKHSCHIGPFSCHIGHFLSYWTFLVILDSVTKDYVFY